MQEDLASGTDDELSWGEDGPRRSCAEVVLRHYLKQEPTPEQLDEFVEEIAQDWEDGFPWTLYSGELSAKLGLWPGD